MNTEAKRRFEDAIQSFRRARRGNDGDLDEYFLTHWVLISHESNVGDDSIVIAVEKSDGTSNVFARGLIEDVRDVMVAENQAVVFLGEDDN